MADTMNTKAEKLIPVTVEDVLAYVTENRQALSQGAVGGAGSFREWLEVAGMGEGIPLLRGLNLRHADLSLGDFSGIYCDGSTFEGAQLDGANFEQAHLPNTCFKDVMARDVSFTGALLQGANFSGARLIGSGPLALGHNRKIVDFTAADALGANFDHTLCRNIVFSHAQLAYSRFAYAELENVRFNGANMIGVDFDNAKPNFHESRGVHNHPVGVEMTGSIVIGAKNATPFDGKLDEAITTPRQMVDALSRAIAVCRAGFPNYPHARRQVDIRQSAASMLVEEYPQKSAETGITTALEQLQQMMSGEAPGFVKAVQAQRQRGAEGQEPQR